MPRSKAANKEYMRLYRKRTGYTHEKKYRQRKLQLILDYKASKGCKDCGENDPIVLDLDHRNPKEKHHSISDMITGNGFSTEKVTEEIKKCVVRCANCHRRRTAKQQNWYK